MSHSPRVIGQADAALSRVIAETSKTPSASQYWERKRPLFRQLAIRVVEAMHEGLSKEPAVARSILELRSEVLQRAATDSARQAYREWFDRRGVFLSGVAKRLWEAATMVHFPQKSIQPDRDSPPRSGIYVALEAHQNKEFSPNDWRGRLLRPLEWKRVSGLGEAVDAVDKFIRTHQLGGGNFVGLAGRVAKDGQPWAQISYNRRIWQGWDREGHQELDRNGNPIASVEVGTTGKVAVPDAVRSYKVEINAHGGWSANQRRYATPEEADAAGKDLYSRWTAAEDYRVVPSSDPPNVEPVINVKPVEERPGSDSRILFLHVGDAPKQTPKAKTALDYTPQAFPGAKAPDGPAPDLQARLEAMSVVQPQAAVTEQRVLRYSLHINGLWGKKRTPDFHSVTLASRVDPKEPWPLEKLLTNMRNKVAELRVKPGAKLKLLETDVTLTPDGFERITLHTDRTLHTETLS